MPVAKYFLYIVLLLCSGLTAAAHITDKLVVGLYPSPKAEGVPSNLLSSGTPLEVLKRQDGFAEVRLADDSTGWIEATYITEEKPAKAMLLETQARLRQMGLELAALREKQAEGEAPVLVHYSLSEDIRALKRVRDAMGDGRPMPMALREQRVWGVRERLFERVLPRLDATLLADLLLQAHRVDGIVKGLKQPDWPTDPWQALHRLAMGLCGACAAR